MVEGSTVLPPTFAMSLPTEKYEGGDEYQTTSSYSDLFVPAPEDLGTARFSVGDELQMRNRPEPAPGHQKPPFVAVKITKERSLEGGGGKFQ